MIRKFTIKKKLNLIFKTENLFQFGNLRVSCSEYLVKCYIRLTGKISYLILTQDQDGKLNIGSNSGKNIEYLNVL